MAIEIVRGNVVDSDADGILLTVDGADKGLTGNITRQFATTNPKAWAEIESEASYPIPLGGVDIIAISPDLECRQRFAILASTLHHAEVLSDEDKRAVVSKSIREALRAGQRAKLRKFASGVMAGGWRLPFSEALKLTVQSYFKTTYHDGVWPDMELRVLDESDFDQIDQKDIGRYLTVTVIDAGFRVSSPRER